jgi:DNA-binding response OmpR family regulator
MSGFELIENIRDYSDVPIIFLSDDNDIQTLVRAFDAGANDYIVVPFNKVIFIARIKARIRRRDWDIQVIERKLASVKDKQNICSSS